jgi:NAD(P)-dependent dehydrogenase (short-subunit alcohol dehydrogenase family)
MSVVMITGCSRPTGFGQLTALAFAKAGHQVYATMRKPERGAALEKQSAAEGLAIHVIEQDVIAGENSGEDSQLVADMILEAATTKEPLLRWWPGEQGPGLAAARRAMSDTDWLPMLTGEMKLGWWIEGRESE